MMIIKPIYGTMSCFKVTYQQWSPRFPRLLRHRAHHPPPLTWDTSCYLPAEKKKISQDLLSLRRRPYHRFKTGL